MSYPMYRILVVDDEPDYCEVLATILRAHGCHVRQTTRPTEVEGMLAAEEFDLVVTDLIMPELDGTDLLRMIRANHPGVQVILLTAYGTVENAVNAMKSGAHNYLIKGGDPEALLAEIDVLRKLKDIQGKRARAQAQEPAVKSDDEFPYLLTTASPVFQRALDIAKKAAASDANILLLGESGSGKEVIAKYIHRESRRNRESFADINCYALSDSLIESELFGHEKGAFTGAASTRIGRFEAAHGGTLFLDEIGDIPLPTQSKILKSIESKKILRIGRNEPITVDFRLISATNKDLQAEIKAGRFREDLYYRLSTIVIEVPPLRARKEDLDDLIDFFLRRSEAAANIKIQSIDPVVLEYLRYYDYPGNVRELKNIIEGLVVLSEDGVIRANGLMVTRQGPAVGGSDAFAGSDRSLRDIRSEFEARYIEYQLKRHGNNARVTAEVLGISSRQLFNKMKEYGLK